MKLQTQIKRLLLLLIILLLAGCGGGGGTAAPSGSGGVQGGSGGSSSSGTPNTGVGASSQFATIQLNSTLSRSVPSVVTQIRLSGFNSTGELVYGPESRSKGTTLIFSQVPLTVTQIQVEFLNGTTLYGIARVQVTLSANETTVVNDLDFEVVEAVVTSFRIEPGSLELAKGSSGQLRAVAVYSDGSVLDLTNSARWESSSVALSVGPNGLVESSVEGSYQVTAVFGELESSVSVVVSPATLQSLRIEPPILTLPIGTKGSVLVRALFSDGTQQDVTRQASLNLTPSGFATIDASGELTAVAQGQVTLTAGYESRSASSTVNLTPAVLERIEISPQDPSLPNGTSQRFIATGYYSDGSSLDLSSEVFWTVSNEAVFAIDATGLGTGLALGQSEIRATLGVVRGVTDVTVTDAVLERLTLVPETTIPVGLSQQLSLFGHYSDGTSRDLTDFAVYSSEDESVATVSTLNPRGLVTGRSEGTTSILAQFQNITEQIEVRVTPAVLETLTISPIDQQIPEGLGLDFTAQGFFSDGTIRDLTSQVSWTSDPPLVAQVDGSGRAVGLSPGTSRIEASLGAVSDSTQLEVVEPSVLSIRVYPKLVSLRQDNTLQLRAEASYSNGASRDVTNEASWSTDNEDSVSVDQTGLITANGGGEAYVTAALGQGSDDSRVRVRSSDFGLGFFPGVNFGELFSSQIEVGDFNGDGFQDAVTTYSNSGQVEILINNGDGLLNTSVFLETGAGRRLQDIQTEDLNGDGRPDLVVTDSESRRLLVYLNQGAASFTFAGQYALQSGTFVGTGGLFLLDVDEDGDIDMLGLDGATLTGRVSLYRNNGSGVFGAPENSDLDLERPSGTMFYDVDGVNGPDMVWYSNTEADLYAELNDGNGLFGDRITLLNNFNFTRFQVTDVDDDGDMDILTTRHGGANEIVTVYRNVGSLVFEESQSFSPGPYLNFADSKDINGDGYREILAHSLNTNQIYAFVNRGDGTFEPAIHLRGTTRDLEVCDLDNDGDLDLVYQSGIGVSEHFNRGGTFLNAPTVIFSNDISSPVAGDFDKDGDLDFVIIEDDIFDGYNHILLNDGKGNLTVGPGVFRARQGKNGTVADDFNKDGNLDIAVVNSSQYSNSFTVVFGNGDGTFQNNRETDVGGIPTSLVKGDFNADTHVDLAFFVGGEVVLYFNNGNGQFTKGPTRFPAGDNPTSLKAVDIDGDTDLDLLAVTRGDYRVAVLVNQGLGTFAAPVLYNTGEAQPLLIDAADIDGDNDIDLAIAHTQRPTVLMLNNGSGQFSVGTSFPEGKGVAVFGDVNQDGAPDLIADGLRINDGSGNFGEPMRFWLGGRPYLFGDFDLDGDIDIAAISEFNLSNDIFHINFNLPFPARY